MFGSFLFLFNTSVLVFHQRSNHPAANVSRLLSSQENVVIVRPLQFRLRPCALIPPTLSFSSPLRSFWMLHVTAKTGAKSPTIADIYAFNRLLSGGQKASTAVQGHRRGSTVAESGKIGGQ